MDIREADDKAICPGCHSLVSECTGQFGLCVNQPKLITEFSDTELNNELTRRRHIHEKQYEEMMAQGLV